VPHNVKVWLGPQTTVTIEDIEQRAPEFRAKQAEQDARPGDPMLPASSTGISKTEGVLQQRIAGWMWRTAGVFMLIYLSGRMRRHSVSSRRGVRRRRFALRRVGREEGGTL
jgi:cytidylate kinase